MNSKVKALAGTATPRPAAGAGTGGWNHPDMLELGNSGLTDAESRSHSSLWTQLNAPLLAGNDIVRLHL